MARLGKSDFAEGIRLMKFVFYHVEIVDEQ